MPQSPTGIPSVLTVENTDEHIPSVKFLWEFVFVRFTVCKTVGVPSVFGFFIFNRVTDETRNYRQSIFRRMYYVGKNFTDELRALHRRN
jgi:hypothetical protein